MSFSIDPLFIISAIVAAIVGYFYGLLAAALVGIAGIGLLMNKLLTKFTTLRTSLTRWDNVVDRFENALSSPIDQARKEQS